MRLRRACSPQDVTTRKVGLLPPTLILVASLIGIARMVWWVVL